ncbi:MAG: ABC transporter permease [Pirellulaceae bacterium]|nr:ABC transporter permease [Pirellulaceae bacterium]
MNLQPEDFWSFNEWLLRPNAFLESALLQGVVLIVLAILVGLMVGYIISAARYGPVEGFYAVARTIRDLLRFDLPGTSPRRVFALARLAFKEAIRRRVLFVVGLFIVGLLLAGWYLNPESDDPARLYISFVLTATNYLILALALFISAFSLPTDIKSKTIYTIVTKPVRPTEIVLGRMLGFVGVGTLILIPMGLTSYLFVKRGLRHTHTEVVEVRDNNRGLLEGETDYVQFHKHAFTIDKEDGLGLTDINRGHRHVVTQNADGTFTIGPPTGALRARVPSYGEVSFLDRSGNEKEQGIDVGAEQLSGGYSSSGISRVIGLSRGARKIQHGYIEGSTLAAAIFDFNQVTPARYPDGIPVDLSVRAYRSFKGDIETGIQGVLMIRNPDTKAESNPIDFVVQEYQVDEKTLPLQVQGTDKNGEATDLDVFEDLVTEDGRMQLVIKCLDRSQYLGVTKGGVYLRPAETSFGWNLTKAYGSIWLQMTMVTAFGVMFSTFLSGPVAMIATAVCVLLGFSAEQIYDTRHYIDSNISHGGGPIESFVRILQQDAMTTQLDVEEVAGRVIKTVDAAIVYALDAIATALPNLPKMVGTAEYAASGFDIFGALLARHAVATFGYCVLAFLISYFFLKSREIAA